MKIWKILFILWAVVAWPLLAFSNAPEIELLSTAQQAFNDGFQDLAIRYLEDFNDKYPQSAKIVSAKLLLGQCYFLKNQIPKAQEIFEDLNQQTQEKDAILFWLGEVYLKQERYADAQKSYQQVIDDFPQSAYVAQAMYSLGWSNFEQQKYKEAREVFAQLIARFPTHQFSEDALSKIAECDYNLNNFETAIKEFEQYLSKYPQSQNLCDTNLNIAESHYYLDHFEAAVPYYQKVLDGKDCSDDLKSTAYLGESWSYIKLKKFAEADKLIKAGQDLAKDKRLPQDNLALARANLSYEQGNLENAADLFTKFIKSYPQSPHQAEAYLGRANISYSLHKYDEASTDYKRIINMNKDPDDVEKARFGLGWCQIKLGNIQEGVDVFQTVFDKSDDPQTKANALVQMADADQEGERYNDAVNTYERVLTTYPQYEMVDYVQYRRAIALLKSDQIDLALGAFKGLQANFPQSKYTEDIDYYIGVSSFRKGDWKQTVTTIERFLKGLLHPSEFTPEANYILALSYLNLKQPDEALKIFQKILRIYPDDQTVAKNADVGIAKCEFDLGQIKEAVKRFKLIAYKYPKTDAESQALLWLAQYYLKSADYPSAIEFYQQFLERFPDNPQVPQMHYELGQAYEVQNQMDQALEQYKAIKSTDNALMAKAKLAMAGIFSKDMDPQRAVAAYESIIAVHPDFASDAYLKLGQLYRNSQNYEKEIEVYQRALKSKTQLNRAQLQFNLADTLELMSRMDEAIEQYLKIPRQYPDQISWVVKAYLRVAKIYEEGKDWDGAKVTYQKIMQLNTEEAKYAQERLEAINNRRGQ